MTKEIALKNSTFLPDSFFSPTSPVLTVALGCLAAIGAGLALYGGLTGSWDVGITIGLGSGALLTGIAAIGSRIFGLMNSAPETEEQGASLSSNDLFFDVTLPALLKEDCQDLNLRNLDHRSLNLCTEKLSRYDRYGKEVFSDRPIAPQVGHYRRGYPVRTTALLLSLPRPFLTRFPKAIEESLKHLPDLEIFFVIHNNFSRQRFRPHSFDITKNNLLLHPLIFPDATSRTNKRIYLEAGFFSTEGIEAGWEASDPDGVGIERWKELEVHVHNSACSPNTGRFRVTKPLSCFFTGVRANQKKGAAIFNVILNGEDPRITAVWSFLKKNTTLSGFFSDLLESEELKDQPVIQKIQTFFA